VEVRAVAALLHHFDSGAGDRERYMMSLHHRTQSAGLPAAPGVTGAGSASPAPASSPTARATPRRMCWWTARLSMSPSRTAASRT
jgi:hypothetical protein